MNHTYIHENIDKSAIQSVSDVPLDIRSAVGDIAHRQKAQWPKEDAQTGVVIAYSIS